MDDAASHDADYAGTVEVLRLAEASPAVSRISLLSRDGLVHDNHRAVTGQWRIRVSAVEVLAEARETRLSRLQRTALANRLVVTLQRLERAGLAHPALRDMAAEVEQGLAPLAVDMPVALGSLHETTSVREAGIGPIRGVGPDLRLPSPEPPGLSLGMDG